ncbi:tumor protein p63-regulated gene 1-like protein [Lineus longissimus]|uniref:tumor protein p63-regulated gene 1-like protein n=1 Tax=Lineus longissimus TaxID=88925 RepID=UPI002B4CF77C
MANPISSGPQEARLEDEKSAGNSDFTGATLQFGMQGGEEPNVDFAGPGLGRSRPHSGSTLSRQSVSSTGSKTSLGIRNTVDYVAKGFFSKKDGYFEKAVDVAKELLRNDLDGDVKGAWLLSEIDHWDNEKEKIIILNDNSVVVIKYDFVTEKVLDHRRVFLHMIDTVTLGDLVYPEKSLMPPRNHGGVRASWNRNQALSFGQKWNPWCTDIPYLTLTHHPLLYNEKERETITYSVDDFYESFIQQIHNCYQRKDPGKKVKVEEAPIMIETYASLSSMVFNQSYLGFSRERGGVSF